MKPTTWPATLHDGDASQQIEVSASAQSLTLHLGATKQQWPFRETSYRSGGLPRFEHGGRLLIVPDHTILDSIKELNPQALDSMEQVAPDVFNASDFATGLVAVLVVMGGAALLALAIWFFRNRT